MNQELDQILRGLQRNIIRGVITAGPLFITWLVFSFILSVLANAGLPLVKLLGFAFPGDAWINQLWSQYCLAVLLTIAIFYVVGRLTSHIVGSQLFGLFEAALERLPLVNKIYASVRQLVHTLTSKNQSGHRVVLIDFPIAGQKSIGFLTHTMSDATTGMPLAAVLVPQAINPSSAYLQFVPMHMVTETDLTMEQAMSMLLTGGAVCPETICYSAPVCAPEPNKGAAMSVSGPGQHPSASISNDSIQDSERLELAPRQGL